MQLEEFVQSTIQQIVQGAVTASHSVAELGGRVNPYDHNMLAPTPPRITNVEFDVALVVGDSQQTEVGGKLSINVFSLGGKTQGAESYQQTSRVKFTVSVELPKG